MKLLHQKFQRLHPGRTVEVIQEDQGPPVAPEQVVAADEFVRKIREKNRTVEVIQEDQGPQVAPEQVFAADEFVRKIREKKKDQGIKTSSSNQQPKKKNDSSEIATFKTSNRSRRADEGVTTDERNYNDMYQRVIHVQPRSREYASQVTASLPHTGRVEQVDEEMGTPSHSNKDSSERWQRNQRSLAMCCPIVLILAIIVIALSVKLATSGCTAPGCSANNQAPGAVAMQHAMRAKFVKILFPGGYCSKCNFRIALHNRTVIVAVNSSVHFFKLHADWEHEATIKLDTSYGDTPLPVALSGEIAVAGNPHDNVGVAHVFEKVMDKWTETLTKPLEYGFDNRDLDVDVGIVSNFGKTVAVDSSMNMIAIGADASMGRVVPAFLFKKTRFGWARQAILPPYSDRQTKVNQVSLKNGMALVSLSDPPFQVSKDSVYLFKQQNSSTAMARIQRVENASCKSFGRHVASFMNDGSIIISCIRDSGDLHMLHYRIPSGNQQKASPTSYELGDWLKIDLETISADILDTSRFAVDSSSLAFIVSASKTAHIFQHIDGIWKEAAVIPTSDESGTIAISGTTVLMETRDNVALYTLEPKDCKS